jgi:hypothetical protein
MKSFLAVATLLGLIATPSAALSSLRSKLPSSDQLKDRKISLSAERAYDAVDYMEEGFSEF